MRRAGLARSASVAGGLVASTLAGCAQKPPAPVDSRGARLVTAAPSVSGGIRAPLLSAVRDTLRARNANIDSVDVLETHPAQGSGSENLLIAYGVRGDLDFKGRFDDELYAVVVADDSLARIVRVLDVFPTRRWRDYQVRFPTITGDSVVIEGDGATYHDQPMVRRYRWR